MSRCFIIDCGMSGQQHSIIISLNTAVYFRILMNIKISHLPECGVVRTQFTCEPAVYSNKLRKCFKLLINGSMLPSFETQFGTGLLCLWAPYICSGIKMASLTLPNFIMNKLLQLRNDLASRFCSVMCSLSPSQPRPCVRFR